MACRSVALLTIALHSVFTAYATPQVILMRLKRNPEPMRSFSFSGFNPDGQMAAFTGAAEYSAFGNYGPYYGSPAHESYGPSPSPVQDSYGPPPSGAEQPAAVVADPNNRHQYGNGGHKQVPQEYGPKPGAPAASDSKEPYDNSVEQASDKKHYRGRDGPSSNAEASFNAWFPIMFGVFPNGATGQPSNAAGRGNHNQGDGQNQGGGLERSSLGTTVIANSVSNGRNGVATSHAIAYGNPRSSQK